MRLSVSRRAHSPRRPRGRVPLATALIIAALGVSRIVTAGVGTPFQPTQDTDAFTNCP